MSTSTDADPYSCTVCMDKPRTVVALPCSHLALCGECASKLDHCPICRAAVESYEDPETVYGSGRKVLRAAGSMTPECGMLKLLLRTVMAMPDCCTHTAAAQHLLAIVSDALNVVDRETVTQSLLASLCTNLQGVLSLIAIPKKTAEYRRWWKNINTQIALCLSGM